MDHQPVDDIDRKLIDQLRIDGRRSFGEIGRYVGLSEASVRQRYNRLVDLGIVRVIGMSDASKIGEVEAHLSLRVRGVPLDTVAEQLAAQPEVTFVASALGAYDLSVDVRCRDNAHLSEFVHERLRRIRGVYSVETSAVLEVLKDTYLWAGFREPVTRYVPQRHTQVTPAARRD
ncbi:MAG TPA: Lrp/AsnC family transcriptional regulator [Naasia sp.]|jgi:Lrp/AsnC family transcriptional regulator for asnA, asnC and gidA